jgi:hypothetical protein
MSARLLACGILAASLACSLAQACDKATVLHMSRSWEQLELSNGTEWRVDNASGNFPGWSSGDPVAVCAVLPGANMLTVIVRLSDLSHVGAALTAGGK